MLCMLADERDRFQDFVDGCCIDRIHGQIAQCTRGIGPQKRIAAIVGEVWCHDGGAGRDVRLWEEPFALKLCTA